MDKYYAIRVTRTRTDTTTVYVRMGQAAAAPATDAAKEFLEEFAKEDPHAFNARFIDAGTALEAYERIDVREIDERPVDVTV